MTKSERGSRQYVPRGRHLFVFDLVAIVVAIVGAFALRFDTRDPIGIVQTFLPTALLPLFVQPIVNVAFGLYRREWQYASVRELIAIASSVGTATALAAVIFLFLASSGAPGAAGLPRSFFPLVAMITLILIGGGRFALRVALEATGRAAVPENEPPVPSLVYGAGEAGAALARIAVRDRSAGISIVGFLDDDPRKHGSRLHGHRIRGGLDDLSAIARSSNASQLVVAMPSAPGSSVRAAVDSARELGLAVRIVPPLGDLLANSDRITRLRPVRLDDLLRRDIALADDDELAQYLNGSSVLVTGGGGSIGSELVRQILLLGPRRLTVLDNSEVALWSIEREVADRSTTEGRGVEVALADVRSRAAIDRVVQRAEPDVVFHAAALKHVPMCEAHPSEAVLSNVIGTRNVVEACSSNGVGQFVLISTDKAVHPVSVMGATKRLAELVTVEAAAARERRYAAVRFGNVLGSSGSVVPIFTSQLERGSPLTITHPEATRYFMTIPEAVTLILEAGSDSAPGEIYVLDMGEPVRILDLARDMIRLAGLAPESVEIVFTGLRPGERLHETLWFDHESVGPTRHHRVLRARTERAIPGVGDVLDFVAELEQLAVRADDRAVRRSLVSSGVLQSSDAVAASVS